MCIKRLLCSVAIIFLLVGGFNAITGFTEDAGISSLDHVTAYYFHGNFRCANCCNIEQYTKEAVDKYFQKELSSGKLFFKVINVETRGNEHFTNDYQLYAKSVVLVLFKGGKEVKHDNLRKVWEYLRDKDAFQQYIKNEVEKYLKEL